MRSDSPFGESRTVPSPFTLPPSPAWGACQLSIQSLRLPRMSGLAGAATDRLLLIAKQSFESVVHVLLDVAVKQGQPGLIRGEIHNGSAVVGNHDRILQDASRLLAVDLRQLPQVPVKMHGMRVIGAIAHDQAVPRSTFQHEFTFVRIRFAINQP